MEFFKGNQSFSKSAAPAAVRRSLLRRVQQGGRQDEAPGNGQLTDVQIGILAARATGKTRKEIAFALGLSLKTVEYHFSKIYRCLDITNDIELTHYAIRCGLIGLKQFAFSHWDGASQKTRLRRKARTA
jgi:DNA-binding NarL/FixJ family response regulator